jgi:hypothetical protein
MQEERKDNKPRNKKSVFCLCHLADLRWLIAKKRFRTLVVIVMAIVLDHRLTELAQTCATVRQIFESKNVN